MRRTLARLARFVLEIEILPRMRLEPGIDGAISGLTRYILVSIGSWSRSPRSASRAPGAPR